MINIREWLTGEPGVVIHGLTSRTGRVQLPAIQAQGTRVVAGVSARHAGTDVDGIPIYPTMAEASAASGATVGLLFVPARYARAVAEEALAAGIRLLVVLAEGMPVMDALTIKATAGDAVIIGPNSPGLIVPGLAKLGFMPSTALRSGPVGIVSRSGTLSYEVSMHLTQRGIGVSTWVGVGGDLAPLLPVPDAAELVTGDPVTKVLVTVGEVGGTGEERLAERIADGTITVPVHSLMVGGSAGGDEPLGHAGAVMLGGAGSYGAKVARLREVGVTVHDTPWELAEAVGDFSD